MGQKKWDIRNAVRVPTTVCGQAVAYFLNRAKGPARLRIVRILEMLRTAAKQTESARETLSEWEKAGAEVYTFGQSPIDPLVDSINRLLTRYKPRLRVATPTKTLYRLRTEPQPQNVLLEETEVAQSLLTLAGEGWAILNLLRKCEGCGEWFFAARSNQKCCTPNCRHKKFEKTDGFKESRRLYMRAQYWRERASDLRFRITEIPKTPEGQKTKARLKEKRRTARAKLSAASQELEALKESGGTL